jgi:hypothetical protein
MEAIALGIAIGAGAVLALKNGRERAKKAVGWAARHAGWISGQVNVAVENAKRVAREEFSRGRDENLAKIAEMAPLSVRPQAQNQAHNGASANGTNGTTHQPS